jgi:dTDP-glucose 4,6-dehydratase
VRDRFKKSDTILVTGGAGFIGSHFILDWLAQDISLVINFDKLTYAGNMENLAGIATDPRHVFVQGDINERDRVLHVMREWKPRTIVHFAAETHVDRSIHDPGDFVRTNLSGTFNLLECARRYYAEERDGNFLFVHVSTDEVYGSLSPGDPPSSEDSPYRPGNPYAASKAGADHMVRAYYRTYGLPAIITNCSNNYGPRQFPEKLIPLSILNACEGKHLPIYGDGSQIRDWLHVADHCRALRLVLERGRAGETYNIGGGSTSTNLETVKALCAILDDILPDSSRKPHERLIRFVEDRPGHDQRYALDCSKLRTELQWFPDVSFAAGLRKTVDWYLSNRPWLDNVLSGDYRRWIERNYAGRGTA